jgi:hypothetical protein
MTKPAGDISVRADQLEARITVMVKALRLPALRGMTALAIGAIGN